jgi:hypothetical protein
VIGRIEVSLFSRGRHARFDRTAGEKVKTADALLPTVRRPARAAERAAGR